VFIAENVSVADVLIFNDDGAVTDRYRLGSESGSASPDDRFWGIDLPPGVWHTILARTERVVCFEVKPGPWKPTTDKDFAAWAPAENEPSAAAYGKALLASAARELASRVPDVNGRNEEES